jgi:HlyD family secretion protein
MKRKTLLLATILVLTIVTTTLIWGHDKTSPAPAQANASPSDWTIAGPGRVEPVSEDIKLAAELSGKLKAIYVEEGNPVKRGQVLAELENSDYRAEVESAEAEVKAKEAELRKVVNGARREERLEALASVDQAEAVMRNARAEMIRHQKLYSAGVISEEEADTYAKQYQVAKAQYESKVQTHQLLDEPSREEDRSMAAADLQNAVGKLDQARALLAKTYVRSSIDGTVLRRYHRVGESVSNGATTPDPIFAIGDTSTLCVRVDVDEDDVSSLAFGQKAYVTADAYGNRRFWGHVVRVGEELGPKNVRTDEPTERVDRKILETLVELDHGVQLPVGLRVNAFIVNGGADAAGAR